MTVEMINSLAEFEAFIKDGTVAIDFYADWCGPCKMISPKFVEFAGKYKSIKFAKVNVDDASDVAEHCGISAMPTFFFYKDGTKLDDELKGASQEKLQQILEKLSS